MGTHLANANPHDQYPLIANALKEMADAGLVDEVLKNLGLGEAAKRDIGTGASQIPDMSAFTGSFSANGWARRPDGLIEMWGSATLTSQGQTFSFPIPFPASCFQIIVSDIGSGHFSYGASPTNNSQFQVWSGGSNVQFRYYAKGI